MLGIGFGIVGATALVWVLPPIGLIAAWPFLFLIPGWLLIARVAPHLPAPGRLGLAIVSSVYI